MRNKKNNKKKGPKGSDGVVSDKSDTEKCGSIMSAEKTVHQYSKMPLRSRRKPISDRTGGKKPGVPALGLIHDETKYWRRKLFSSISGRP